MNIPTYSNVPVMLVYFKLFYYDVALYPIFEVCNVLRVQISYKRVAHGDTYMWGACFALLFALNPQLQILRVNIHVGSARLRFVVRYRNGIYHDVLGFAVVRSFALCENAAVYNNFAGSDRFRNNLNKNVVCIYTAALFHLNASLMLVTKSASSLAMAFSACFSAEVRTSRPLLST